MRHYILLPLLLMMLLLGGCQDEAPPLPEGPTVGDIPIMPGASEMEEDALLALRAVNQAHGAVVRNPASGYFKVEQPLIETMDFYHQELLRLGWDSIDLLEFGDGGYLRRYHQGERRAILAFHPSDSGTEFLLLQGTIQ